MAVISPRKALLDKLILDFEKSGLSVSGGVLALSAALLQYNHVIGPDWEKEPKTRIEKLLCAWRAESGEKEPLKNPFLEYELPGNDDDLTGAFYQSVQSAEKKSMAGAYYTPAELLREIKIPRDKTVYDPCCGSGGILLKILDKTHDPAKVFASDIDGIALKICAVNLALFFNNGGIESKIAKKDIVFMDSGGPFAASPENKYDYIVTNPPWGYKFSPKQKNDILSLYPKLETTEIFSIALNNCLDLVEKQGRLYFFLPHAFLNVAAHKKIRQKLLRAKGNISLRLLGNAFRGVMSECVLLYFKASNNPVDVISITDMNGNSYGISRDDIAASDFIIRATVKDADAAILEKIYAIPHTTLADDGIFAMGLVTGNNKNFLQKGKTTRNEAIYRGKDILPYRFSPPEYFIEFAPEKMQQIAQTEFYRQKKIAYRFISSRLVCALDENGSLLLNSANLFITRRYPMETIVCLLNSPVYAFIFQKKFHSRKVLKSHLRELPLPVLSESQHGFFYSIYSGIVNGQISPDSGQSEIDNLLVGLFKLTKSEYTVILRETNRDIALFS